MNEETLPEIDKKNAATAYCFMAAFMLISRQSQYRGSFVRQHAQYATLLQIGFVFLIFFLLSTRSLGSFVLFDAVNFEVSFFNIFLFVLFFALLGVTIDGIIRALRGSLPRFSLQGFHSELEVLQEIEIAAEKDKIPLILSHIPFIGIYLAYKYQGSLIYGARWGTWCTVIAIILLWIDSSLFLFIAWIILTTLGLVYQSVHLFSHNTIRLLGEKFPSAQEVQIFMRVLYRYVSHLANHSAEMPIWGDIIALEKTKYTAKIEEVNNVSVVFPFINVFGIWKKGNLDHSSLQGIIITVLVLLFFLVSGSGGTILIILAIITGYSQIRFQKRLDIPVISEGATLCEKIIAWKKAKSTPQVAQAQIISQK